MIIRRHFNRALLTIGLIGVCTTAFAQEQKSALAMADAHYLRYEYKQAIVFYEDAASKRTTIQRYSESWRIVTGTQIITSRQLPVIAK